MKGELKPIQVGDKVAQGEQILTSIDGIVQISPAKGPAVLVKAPVSDTDKSIAGLENQDPDFAPAAGLLGGAEGGLQPGLRVERVVESVGQLAFDFGTERVPPTTPFAVVNEQLLFGATVVEPAPVPLPQITVSSPTVNEAAGNAAFVVTLDKASDVPVTVSYTTVDGSAKAGQDYTRTTGSVTFEPGQTSKTVNVPITNDGVYEGSETFNLVLSTPINAEVALGTGLGTIKDDGTGTTPPGVTPDDDRPAISSVGNPTIAEGGNLDFVVKLTHTSTTDTTVTLKLGGGTATPGTDTGAPLVSFDGGKTFALITVDAQGNATITVPANTPADQIVVRVPTTTDNISEAAETFKVTASTPINTVPVEGTGTITDATGQAKLSVTGPTDVNEASGTLTYTVTLSNPSSTPVTVNYGTVDGTAKAGSDYTAATGTLTFAPGETSKTFTVQITNDTVYEGSEAFQVKLTNPTGASITSDTVRTTIKDDGTGTTPPGVTPDDDRFVLSVNSPNVTEGNKAVFTVDLGHAASATQALQLTVVDGSAKVTSDYTATFEVSFDNGLTWQAAASGLTMVPAGQMSLLVRIPTVNDTATEPLETFSLKVASTVAVNASSTGTATIVDNDAPSVIDLDPNNSSGATGSAYATTYVENGAGVRVTDVDVQITDTDSTQLTGATITLSNAQPGDVLSVAGTLPAGVTATINGNVVTLSGAASLADYQAALHVIAFSNTSDNPSTLDRHIEIKVTDGEQVSNVAIATIAVTTVNDAPVVGNATGSVSEEGLNGGIKDSNGSPDTTDSATVSGQVAISDPDSAARTVNLIAPSTPVFTTVGKQLVWVSDGQGGLIGKAGTAVSAPTAATVTINSSGQYTFNLLTSLKHTGQGEGGLSLTFGVKVSDGIASTTGNLTINVEDDAPNAPVTQTKTLAVQDTNLMFVLDVSGSMNDPSGISGLTRLQAAVQAMKNLLDKYDDFGTVAVRLVTFSGTSQTVGDTWLTVADAKAQLATITATGSTNYDYALSAAQTAFATTAGKISGAQNVSYFLSDGNPTLSSTNPDASNGQDDAVTQTNLGDGIDAIEEAAWTKFLNDNQINAFAIGLGTGVAQTYLNPVAHNGQFALSKDGVVVSDLAQLGSTLSGTVPGSVVGQLFTPGSVGGTAVGADGGRLQSVRIDSIEYVFDPAKLILIVKTPSGGDFTLNWLTGEYTYKAPDGLNGSRQDTITYTVVDGDGDTVSSTLVLNLVRNVPVEGAPTVTATEVTVSEEGLAGGNKDTQGSPDTTDNTSGSGQISFQASAGASVLGFILTAPQSALLTSSGKTVVWTSDNAGGLIGKDGSAATAQTVATITVTKAGGYTFNLLQPVQHAGSGEGVKDIAFGVKVLDSNQKVGMGSLVVHIEDDAPTAAAPVTTSLTTLDTNLLIVLDTSNSMSGTSGVTGLSRLQAAVQSIGKLLDQYDDLGGVAVRLVTFSTTSQTKGNAWLSVADAKALLATVVADGATNYANYDHALTQAQGAFATTEGKLSGAQNVSYFFSDSDPTLSSTNPTHNVDGQNGTTTQANLGDGIDGTEETGWTRFLNDNQITSHAIGLGNNVAAASLNPIAYDGQASENLQARVVSNLSQLDSTLNGIVGSTVTGNLVTSGQLSAAMGADAFGHVASLTVDGVTHLYDAAQTTQRIHTTLGGDLTVDMSTGGYTYGGADAFSGTATENITFALADKDGDTASSSLAIQLTQAQVLVGGTGADVPGAQSGSAILIGGPGNDTLNGGAGVDVFAWHFADPGTSSSNRAVDTIQQFDVAAPSVGGDVLDLRDLLTGENAGNLQNYLEFDTSTANTVIKISPTGDFPLGLATNSTETQRIVLENVNIRSGLGLGGLASDAQVINKLLEQGKLLVDTV